jgi:hypothetical protein
LYCKIYFKLFSSFFSELSEYCFNRLSASLHITFIPLQPYIYQFSAIIRPPNVSHCKILPNKFIFYFLQIFSNYSNFECVTDSDVIDLMSICTNDSIRSKPAACSPDLDERLKVFAGIWAILISLIGTNGNLFNICAVTFAASRKK